MKMKHMAAGLGAALLVAALPGQAAAQGNGPYQFHSLTPCRIVDTRNSGEFQGAYGPILQSGVERKFPIQGNCGVPVGARAVSVNVTVATPTWQGRLTLYPASSTVPAYASTTSTINFPPGTFTLANGAIVPLADQAQQPNDLGVMPFLVDGGRVHMILDVTGYFM